MALAAAVQAPHGLLEQLQRPRQRQERDPTAAMLEVQPMPSGLGVDQQQFNLARVPVGDGVSVVDRLGVRIAALEFGQLQIGRAHV